jgi:ATP-dependent helicase/nuclease subunit A
MNHRHGELVVLAGAGSGKTATLAERCAQLVANPGDPCDVRELLVLTFTREAADEMRSRIGRAIREKAVQPGNSRHSQHLLQQAALVDTAHISTFHAFCLWAAKTWFMFCHVDPAFSLLTDHEAAMLQSDSLRETARQWMHEHHPQRSEFIALFDLYAEATLGRLESLVLPILHTLEALADPQAWQVKAAAAGDAEINGIIGETVANKCHRLHELAVMLAAAADDAGLFDADTKKNMSAGLRQAAQAAVAAEEQLQTHGPTGWHSAAEILANITFAKQIRLKDCEDTNAAKHFKEGTYAPLKTAVQAIAAELAAASISTLSELEKTSRRRIATLIAFAQAVQTSYQQAKQTRNQLDYSDLERTIITALSSTDNPLQAMLHQRFRHILVDEYQDINPVQQRLIELLYRGDAPANGLQPGSLFGVGDVLQSIYGFRGSEPRILHEKVRILQSTGQTDKVITMRENFRTLPSLLDAINAIIHPLLRMVDSPANALQMAPLSALSYGRAAASAGAFNGLPVELHVLVKQRDAAAHATRQPAADTGTDADAADMEQADDAIGNLQADELEATRIGQLILAMRQDQRKIGPDCRTIEFGDIAILLRSTKQRAPHYVRVLNAMGISANAALSTGFFESSEVLEVLDILRTLDNPQQDIALAGVLLGPVGDCTPAELALIRKSADKHIPFHQAVQELTQQTPTAPALQTVVQKINRALRHLEKWRVMLRSQSLVNSLARILHDAGLFNRAAALPGGRQRLANLRLLQQRAMEFSGFDLQSLSRFLAFFERLREERDLGEAAPPAGNAVRVMSIHASKGLEFPVVFVASLGTKFNTRDQSADILVDRDKGMGITIYDDNGVLKQDSPGRTLLVEAKKSIQLQEESRLLYVAMTRAQDQLILVGRAEQATVDKWDAVRLPREQPANQAVQMWEQANRPLDWLGPIFAQSKTVPETTPLLALHVMPEDQIAAGNAWAAQDPAKQSVANGDTSHSPDDPPSAALASDGPLQATLQRITGRYKHSELTQLPAVCTVSRLKAMAIDDMDSPSHSFDAPSETAAAALSISGENAGAQTGLIMHRVLQRLDVAQSFTADSLTAEVDNLVARGFLTKAERTVVDCDALLWFFSTPLGQRMQAAAAEAVPAHQLLRELSFIWSIPAGEMASAVMPPQQSRPTPAEWSADVPPGQLEKDQALIRGTVDALLIEPGGVEIIDYKTDAALFIQSRLSAYQRQVAYYARAASAILRVPVTHTSLIFFSTRQITRTSRTPAPRRGGG